MPKVILDADNPGKQIAKNLKDSLYEGNDSLIISMGDILGFDDAEVEDLVPLELFSWVVTRFLRGPEEEFEEVVENDKPLVPQVEAYAEKHSINLEQGWKVDVAKRVKERMLARRSEIDKTSDIVQKWIKLFEELEHEDN